MTYEHVTLCFSLPRSRSQWLAWLYSHGVESWHDPLKHCESPLDLKARIDARGDKSRLFIADTSALLFHTSISASLPGARKVYVMRPITEVIASIERQVPRSYEREWLLSKMCQRLRAQASVAEPGHFAHYSTLADSARAWWPSITGKPNLGAGFFDSRCAIRIDTPLRDQESYPYKTRLLMRYVE